MTNELLWFLMLISNFLIITYTYKAFGKIGLYAWVPISSILANLQVILLVNLFGYETTLGNIMYAGGFLVTDILSENYGEKSAKKAVKIGFISMIAMAVLMKIAVSFTPSKVIEAQGAFDSLKMVFDFMPRVLFASLAAYALSQWHDVWAYSFWKRMFPQRRFIWLRNNASTIFSQFLDNSIFTLVAFYGVYSNEVLLEVFLVTYLMKVTVALFDTPFVYLATYIKDKKWVKDTHE